MLSKRILIVGSGPVGLSAALFLSRLSPNITIIDKNPQRSIYSKALLTNTRTLNLLHTMNAETKIIQRSAPLTGAKLYFNDQPVFSANIFGIKINPKGYYGQKLVNLPQSLVEECLEESLKEKGVKVNRGVELLGLINKQDGRVETTTKESTGEVRKEDYDIVVGCDGARSVVRHQINADFQGHTIPNQLMYMSDYKLKTDFHHIGLRLFTKPQPFILGLIPVQKGVVRVISNNPNYGSLLPADMIIQEELWRTSFKINHRLSNKLKQGNIFIAGDAAHVHSPLGGRGMNIGIQDVYVLSELLREGRPEDYEEERYKVLKPLVKRIRTMSEFMMVPNKLKYRAIGLGLKHFGWMLPKAAYQNFITFLTGQDHEI